MFRLRRLVPALIAATLAACSSPEAPRPPEATLGHGHEHASTFGFTNGDFETGAIAPWVVATYSNSGLGSSSPTTRAQLNLGGSSNDLTKIVSGAEGTVQAAGAQRAPGAQVRHQGHRGERTG